MSLLAVYIVAFNDPLDRDTLLVVFGLTDPLQTYSLQPLDGLCLCHFPLDSCVEAENESVGEDKPLHYIESRNHVSIAAPDWLSVILC